MPFDHSIRNPRLEEHSLSAEYGGSDGRVYRLHLDLNTVLGHSDGKFVWNSRGFYESARCISLRGSELSAELPYQDGWTPATVDLGEHIRMKNGRLGFFNVDSIGNPPSKRNAMINPTNATHEERDSSIHNRDPSVTTSKTIDHYLRNARVIGEYLVAEYRDSDGRVFRPSLNLDAILGHSNGKFIWGGRGFTSSARNISLNGFELSAELPSLDEWNTAKVDLREHIRLNHNKLESFNIKVSSIGDSSSDSKELVVIVSPDVATEWFNRHGQVWIKQASKLGCTLSTEVLSMQGGRLYPAVRVVGPRKLTVIEFTNQLVEASGFSAVLEYHNQDRCSAKDGGSRNGGRGGEGEEGSHIGLSFIEEAVEMGRRPTSFIGGSRASNGDFNGDRYIESFVNWISPESQSGLNHHCFSTHVRLSFPASLPASPNDPYQGEFRIHMKEGSNWSLQKGHIVLSIGENANDIQLSGPTRPISSFHVQNSGIDATSKGATFLVTPDRKGGKLYGELALNMEIHPKEQDESVTQPTELKLEYYFQEGPSIKSSTRGISQRFLLCHQIIIDDVYTFYSQKQTCDATLNQRQSLLRRPTQKVRHLRLTSDLSNNPPPQTLVVAKPSIMRRIVQFFRRSRGRGQLLNMETVLFSRENGGMIEPVEFTPSSNVPYHVFDEWL